METYEVRFWGLSGDDWEGEMDVEFSDREIRTIKRVLREEYCDSFDYAGLENIEARLISMIADWLMDTWDAESLYDVYEKYSKKGRTHRSALIKYLQDGVHICIPEEIIDEVNEEDEEEDEE